MCVGLAGKIVEIKGRRAKIKQGEHFHWVDIEGDYLLTYQKAGINKIPAREAKEIIQVIHGLNPCILRLTNPNGRSR
jgi:hydrogenase maturation factor